MVSSTAFFGNSNYHKPPFLQTFSNQKTRTKNERILKLVRNETITVVININIREKNHTTRNMTKTIEIS